MTVRWACGNGQENTSKSCGKITNQEEFRMKSTGIVRKVDELGRVVIPMELRRNIRY